MGFCVDGDPCSGYTRTGNLYSTVVGYLSTCQGKACTREIGSLKITTPARKRKKILDFTYDVSVLKPFISKVKQALYSYSYNATIIKINGSLIKITDLAFNYFIKTL
jgi:hypothetical protein